jgi:hypothetical protein
MKTPFKKAWGEAYEPLHPKTEDLGRALARAWAREVDTEWTVERRKAISRLTAVWGKEISTAMKPCDILIFFKKLASREARNNKPPFWLAAEEDGETLIERTLRYLDQDLEPIIQEVERLMEATSIDEAFEVKLFCRKRAAELLINYMFGYIYLWSCTPA